MIHCFCCCFRTATNKMNSLICFCHWTQFCWKPRLLMPYINKWPNINFNFQSAKNTFAIKKKWGYHGSMLMYESTTALIQWLYSQRETHFSMVFTLMGKFHFDFRNIFVCHLQLVYVCALAYCDAIKVNVPNMERDLMNCLWIPFF